MSIQNTNSPTYQKRPDESAKAYAAFRQYMLLPARERSIDAAWRAANQQQTSSDRRANGQWMGWSAKYNWVERAAAYDQHLAKQDEELWEERRRRLREQDWSQAEELRSIITEALPYARGFIHRQKHVVRRAAQTTTTIIESFDIVGLSKVLTEASKIQRLSTGDSTENINNLSGAALDAAIARALAELADAGQAGHAPAPADDEASADDDARTARGDPPLPG